MPATGAEAELALALARLLGDLAGEGASIDGLRRLSGGASRETWSFDVVGGDGTRRELILQRQRGAASASALSLTAEAELLRVARTHGVPVAPVVASDDGTVLGRPAMVVDRLPGETIPRRILRDDEWAPARQVLATQVATAAAAIHAVPADALGGLGAPDPVAQCRALLDGLAQPHPAFELGLRWLDAHRPPARPPALVHGDLRMGNLLVDRGGLRAVLDWELAHRGDPVEDLGWFCVRAWRFGSPEAAGGVATREAFVAAYVSAAGRTVDLDELRWWELLGTVKWGAICILQAWGHLSGATRSVELATIGRRVCENEWDVLGLLPGGPLPAGALDEPPTDPAVPPGPHDRPTAVELVEAVREWVDDEVRATTEGRLAFHARVAANALRIVERELRLGAGQADAHAARLAVLGCADDAELVARIRRGELDERMGEVRGVVAASVRDKVAVANPGWLVPDG